MENTGKIEINKETMEKVTGGAETTISSDVMAKITANCNRLKNAGYTVDQAVAWFDSNFDYGTYGRGAVIAIVQSYWNRSART